MWLLLLVIGYVVLLSFLTRFNSPSDQDSSSAPPPPSPSSSSSSFSSSELIRFSNNRSPEIPHPTKYDVFISFRGADVRENFLSHLYLHLNNIKKLAVYKDDVDLPRGAEISPSLLRAIEISDVYVVILSRDYANSEWCLEELEKIFHCVEQHKRMFIPVTYDMSFADFYETLPSPNVAGNVQSWKDQLEKIIGLAGLDYTVIRPETTLIEEITRAVFQAIRGSNELVKFPSYSASRGLVGIESKVKEVERLLRSGERANWTIGLWGMSGIGKTTLAQAFFHTFSSQFQASYFFSNFSGPLASGQLSLQPFGNLQSGFFSQLLGDDGGGRTLPYDLMLRRVGRVKALVVIDDVGNDMSNIGPLKDLLNGQYSDMFGPGSVVIMTGTNQQLLKSVCHTVYQVKGLEGEEDWRLFCLHAFKGEDVPAEFLWLARRAVSYAGGNPLAITLLGAHLYDRDLEFWVGELGYLHGGDDDPNSVVRNIGRRSYEGLSLAEKDLFLDLACFYSYWEDKDLRGVGVIKDGRCNLITNLVDKTLIHIGIAKCIKMSLVLRDLGRSIVNEEGHIRKRSRFWKSEDIALLFKKTKGALPIEGIVLCYDPFSLFGGRPDICIQADAFDEMQDLRFFVINSHYACNIILPEDGLNCLPNTLRILEWVSFPSKHLPSRFSAENLVTLKLKHSKIEQLWEGDELEVDLGNLKTLNLEGSRSLRKLPSLSTAKRLESMHLKGCVTLEELPSSIGDLTGLSELVLTGCKSLSSLPDTIHKLKKLQTLQLDDCNQLRHLPRLPPSLEVLDAHGCTSLRTMSVDDDAGALSDSEHTRWCFGCCWNLDQGVRRKIVDKFIERPVQTPLSSELLVPANWVANNSGSEEGSTRRSSYKSRATAKLRGQPWKLKSLLFCILFKTPPHKNLGKAFIHCFMPTIGEYDGIEDMDEEAFLETKTGALYWIPLRKCETEDHKDEKLRSNHHLVVWSKYRGTDIARKAERAAERAADADGVTVEFSFYGDYSSQETTDTSILIKNCRVIPMYDDRVVTYEDEDEGEDDDQYPVNLEGLYDQMCSGQ